MNFAILETSHELLLIAKFDGSNAMHLSLLKVALIVFP